MKIKRLLASIMVFTTLLSSFTVSVSAKTNIGTIEELQNAINKARPDSTITLTGDITGPGIVIDKSINIDLNDYTYTISESPVDGNIGFKLTKGNTISFKNGKIKATEDSGVKTLVKNYSELVLIDVDLDSRDIKDDGITLHTLNGKTTIRKTLIYTFDSNGVAVKVNADSNTDKNSVFFKGGNIVSGEIVFEEKENVSITADQDEIIRTPNGFVWIDKYPNSKILTTAKTITYVLDKENTETKKYKANDTVILDYKPTKANFKFIGWYLEPTFETKVEKCLLSEDKTLYAKWEEVEETESTKFTITFMSSTGEKLDTIQRKNGYSIDLYTYKYSVKNHNFKGWFLDKSLTQRVDTLKVEKDTIIYGKYVKEENTFEPILREPLFKKKIFTTDHIAYVMGKNNGLIYPNADITRAEVATMFYRLLTPTAQDYYTNTNSKYIDVTEKHWAQKYIIALTNANLLNGRTETIFRPDDYITRAEFVTIIYRVINGSYFKTSLFPDIEGHWAQEQISYVKNEGYINGTNGLFRPDDYITRAEAIAIINRVFGRLPESISSLSKEMKTFKDNQNINAWYYLDIQEATNSHDYTLSVDGLKENWIKILD